MDSGRQEPANSCRCTMDCRAKGRTRYKTMTLEAGEFMRHFLLHVLPNGFHRIRRYAFLTNARRVQLARVADSYRSATKSGVQYCPKQAARLDGVLLGTLCHRERLRFWRLFAPDISRSKPGEPPAGTRERAGSWLRDKLSWFL